MKKEFGTKAALIFAAGVIGVSTAEAGPSGSELDLGLMPASGGMEGVGVVRPQDPVAMVFGNAATLVQMDGKFTATFGGSYVSPDLEAEGTATVGPDFATGGFLGGPVDGQSRLEHLAMPHAAVVHRLSDKFVYGMGITGVSGLGSDFRKVVNVGLIADLKLFGAGMSAGFQVNDQLAVGGTFVLGIGSLQVGTLNSTASVNNFGVSGSAGFTYDMGIVQIGGSYKSEMKVDYNEIVQIDAAGTLGDFTLTQPADFAFGIATTDKFNSGTLFELNYRWKNYSKAAGYKDFWRNQWKISGGISPPDRRKTDASGRLQLFTGHRQKARWQRRQFWPDYPVVFPGRS